MIKLHVQGIRNKTKNELAQYKKRIAEIYDPVDKVEAVGEFLELVMDVNNCLKMVNIVDYERLQQHNPK